MAKLTLIHFGTSDVEATAADLRRAGHAVTLLRPEGSPSLRMFDKAAPEAILIDLHRRPGEGRAVAVWLRQRKATRSVPLVFLGGDPDKVARVRTQLPDAVYAAPGDAVTALRDALRNRPEQPVVPGTMDAYSGTPLDRKLGVKPGQTLVLLGAPAGFDRQLGPVVDRLTIRRQSRARGEVVMLFVRAAADLHRRLPAAERAMKQGGSLWIAWPKQASGEKTDVTQTLVRKTGLDAGLVDYKIASIDATWSALRFARRG